MADGYLNFDTTINTKGFSQGVNGLEKQIDGLKSTVRSLGAAVAAAFSARMLVNFGKQAIEIASDMQEVQNVVDKAFGSMSYKMEEFADNAIEMYGISKLTAKQTGSTFAAMASGMGITLDRASDMAVALTGLSADMASFYNVEQETAATALKSVFTGETETLKQFGIVMSQANLEAYALSQGITSSYQAMTEAEKVQLRYGFVMQATALAQGDFAKTSGGWANQVRILSEQWKEFSSVIGNVAMNVLLPVVRSLNSAMSSLIDGARSVAESLADLFGIEIETGSSAAQISSSAAQAANSYDDMAGSAQAAAKANEKSLASFDKITKLSSLDSTAAPSASATSGAALGSIPKVKIDADTAPASKKIGKLKEQIGALADPFVSALETNGNGVIKGIQNAFGGLKTLFKEVGKSFADVWTGGAAEEAAGHVLGIMSGRLNTVGNLAGGLAQAWSSGSLGTDILQNAADALNTYLGHLENISEKTADWAETVDFKPLLSSLEELTEAFEPLADAVGQGLEDFYTEVLLPLAGWTIEDAIPQFLTSLKDIIEGLTSVWNAAYPVIKEKLWDGFLKPIASWTAGIALTALDGLSSAFKAICGSISSKDVEVMLDLAGAVTAIYAAAKGKKALDGLGETLSQLGQSLSQQAGSAKSALSGVWSTLNTDITKSAAEGGASFSTKFTSVAGAAIGGWQIGSAIADAIGRDNINAVLYPIFDAFVAAWNGITTFFTETVPEFFSNLGENIKGVFASIGEWFSEKFTEAKNGVVNAFSSIGEWFGNIKNSIVGAFASIGTWFSNKFTEAKNGVINAFAAIGTWASSLVEKIKAPFLTIADWFREKFSAAWTAVKNVFSKGGEIFNGIKEGILSGLKTVINSLIDGINSVVAVPFNGINTALKKIKKISIAGFEPFDWIKTIDVPQIPKLATGTVIPANYGEFLAVLGDNKREAEVIAPESAIVSAVKKALLDIGFGGDNVIYLTVTLDGDVVYKTVVRKNRENSIRTGSNALAT